MAMGMSPMMVVVAVRSTGLRRVTPASAAAETRSIPRCCNWRV
ncbi:hypothetical protein ES703_95494 [subsurface metagenome]